MPRLPELSRVKKPGSEAGVLGARLRAARLAAHLTQRELAGERFSKSYISAIERGNMVPSLPALTYLAEKLQVPRSALLGESEIDGRALEVSDRMVYSVAAPASQIDEEEARRRLGQAETFIRQDRSAEAWEHLGAHVEPPGGWPLQLRPHWAWLAGWDLFLLGRPVEAVGCLEQGLQLAETLRLHAPHARRPYWNELIEWLHCFLGVAHCAQGNTLLALEFYQRGLEAIAHGRVGNAELKLWVYKGLGNEYFALGRYQQAGGYFQKALAEVQNCNNQRQHGLAAWGLATTYQQQGDLFRAKTCYRQALQAFAEHGNQRLLARMRALYGLALITLEDCEEAERQLQKSLDAAERLGNTGLRGEALAYYASLYNARGHPDQAIQAAQAALPLARQSGDGRSQGHALFVLVDAYTARQDRAAAERAYQEAIRLAEQLPDEEMLGQARQGYADFLAEQGRFQEAYQALAQGATSALEFARR